MGQSDLETALHYRNCSERVRISADAESERRTRENLRRVAGYYEMLAAFHEDRAIKQLRDVGRLP